MRQCANVPIILLRREDVKSFAALIRQGVKTCTACIREDGNFFPVSPNERSECLHAFTNEKIFSLIDYS